jgi:hypothetical protein
MTGIQKFIFSSERNYLLVCQQYIQLHGSEMLTVLVFIYLDFCIRADDSVYPYGSGVQGTESQSRGNYHPGHQNVTPVGDEAHKPQPRTRGRKRKFVWKVTGYTECTKTCGGGKSHLIVSFPHVIITFTSYPEGIWNTTML